jgi:hypothetical protein
MPETIVSIVSLAAGVSSSVSGSVVENDLRLSVYDGLDELVRAGLATSSNQAPSSDNILVSIRKAITTLRAAGYSADDPGVGATTPGDRRAQDSSPRRREAE